MSGHFIQLIKAIQQTIFLLTATYLNHCNHHWLAAQNPVLPYLPELYTFAMHQCTALNAYLITKHCFGRYLLPRSCLHALSGLHISHLIDRSIRTWCPLFGLNPALHLDYGWSLGISEVLLSPCSTSLCLTTDADYGCSQTPRRLLVSTCCPLSLVTTDRATHTGIAKRTVVSFQFTLVQWLYSGV